MMCVGATLHARIQRLVFGAWDPKRGAVESTCQLLRSPPPYHFIEYTGGILAEECGQMLKDFFRALRGKGEGIRG